MRHERKFWIRLSLIYGIPVPLLQQVIDSDHFTELIVYDRIEAMPHPWLQASVIASTIANVNKTKGPAIEPDAFIPKRKARRTQTAEQIKAIVLGSVARAKAYYGN